MTTVTQSDPTKREAILRFIADHYTQHHYAPSVREIMEGCSLSTKSLVIFHLNKLQGLRLITRDPNVARSILITSRGKAFIQGRMV